MSRQAPSDGFGGATGLHRETPYAAPSGEAADSGLAPPPPELASLWRWRDALLARGAGAREAAEQMEAALDAAEPTTAPEHQVAARRDLGKFWTDQRVPARAFAQWAAAHALLRPDRPFSRDRRSAFIDANIASLDIKRFSEGPRARDDDPAPVFIVGLPHSGAALCGRILAAHAQAHGAGERLALPAAFTALGGGSEDSEAVGRIAALDEAALDAGAAPYLAALHALAPDKAYVIDTRADNFDRLGLVGLMLPGAKIIHCVRDPRDNGLSIFASAPERAPDYAHDLGDLGWSIAEHDRLMAHWKAVLPDPVLTLRLADWVEDFEGTLDMVLTHLDLPPDANCARLYEAEKRVRVAGRARGRGRLESQGFGSWAAYADELAPMIGELQDAGRLENWR